MGVKDTQNGTPEIGIKEVMVTKESTEDTHVNPVVREGSPPETQSSKYGTYTNTGPQESVMTVTYHLEIKDEIDLVIPNIWLHPIF